MKKKTIRTRPIDIALRLLRRQSIILSISFLVPPLLLTAVILTLNFVQGAIFPEQVDPITNELIADSGKWYLDSFTVIIIALFVLGQVMAFKQFILSFTGLRKIRSLINAIAKNKDLDTLDDLVGLAANIRNSVPHSDMRSLVLNWLDYRGDSTVKRNDVLENNSYVRMDLKKEKTTYFHVLMNRITLKLGFLGTLIGLMKTFPDMKNAILSLSEIGNERAFVTDIASAIDGDQYAILTTLIATILSLFAEFLTIQLINRFAVNSEIIMSYLTDWYHTRVEPLYAHGAADSLERMEKQFSNAEEILAQNMQVLTTLADKNATQLEKLSEFHSTIEKRVTELESYENHYRNLIKTKGKAEEHLAGNVKVLTEVAEKTGGQLKGLVSSQEVIGVRVENLNKYEEQYRSLIAVKDEAGVPTHLRPEKASR